MRAGAGKSRHDVIIPLACQCNWDHWHRRGMLVSRAGASVGGLYPTNYRLVLLTIRRAVTYHRG